jgi:hypothetical protein
MPWPEARWGHPVHRSAACPSGRVTGKYNPAMRRVVATARLYLNDRDVGIVQIHGWEGGWGIGEFHPGDGFSDFAPLFGAWSLLMHADDDQSRISRAAASELRAIEQSIDRLRARLHLLHNDQWVDARQVNIDGTLIEWKQR